MKPRPNPLLRLTAALAIACAASAHAANLTWNNSASTGIWNTTDANWTGSTWNNGTPDNAIFHSVGGTVTLASGITAGTVSVGNTGSNFASLTLTGGSLNATSLTVQGFGNNSGAYGSNPTLSVNSTVVISGDAAVGRANLDITGGTFTANRIISAAGSADWGRLVISGGTVTATNGVDGSINTGATFAIDLNGGTLYTPSIKVADREAGTNNDAWLTFNGGTVVATADTTTFITTYGGGNNAYISNGGAIIDTFDGTTAHNITIGTVLRNSWGHNGSLTKNGAGTLTLSGSTGGGGGSYSGATTVNSGVLAMQSGTAWILQGGSAVTVNSGATLQGNDSLANQLNGLTLNSGTVSATGAGNGDWGNFYLTGDVTATGTSSLSADVALRKTNVDFSVASGGTLNVGGTLHNGHEFGQNSGSPSTVSKSGDGTMVLSTAHTYTGATNVNAGKLLINGSTSTSSAVTVASGATLGGTGTVGGATTINGTHAPGNSPGVQSFAGSLSYTSTSIFEWDLASSATGVRGTQYDGVNVGGALSGATGAAFKVVLNSGAFTDTFWNANQTWSDIFKANVDGSGSPLGIASVFSAIQWFEGTTNMTSLTGTQGYFTLSGSNLTWTAVPEPTSALAGLLLTAGLLRRRR